MIELEKISNNFKVTFSEEISEKLLQKLNVPVVLLNVTVIFVD